MLRSMTGFAQIRHEEPPFVVTVTLKAVNHRFLDLHLRLGVELESLAGQIRNQVRKRVRRGHVEVNVQVESSEKPALLVNREYIRSYLELFNALRREYSLTAEPDLTAFLRMPGVVQVAQPIATSAENSGLPTAVERALARTLEELDGMRCAEGARLEQELRTRAETVRGLIEQVRRAAQQARPAAVTRLRQRLQEFLGGTPLDESRLAEAAAHLAERSDVSEEVVRLQSHVEQFLGLLASDGEVGKQLDFLLQEMNRETNTLLSKSPSFDAGGLEMTQLALAIKGEIERLREQVQNVE